MSTTTARTVDLTQARASTIRRQYDPLSRLITSASLKTIYQEFALNLHGPHGFAHWGRVRRNGVELTRKNDANLRVVLLFSIFHDSKRENEGSDPDHGKRGARNALRFMEAGALCISDEEFSLLFKACWGHTYKDVSQPCITVLTCWDADRLDLGRVGIVPHPDRLCTAAGRDQETIQRAYERSMHWVRRNG